MQLPDTSRELTRNEIALLEIWTKNENTNWWYYKLRMPAIVLGFGFTLFVYYQVTKPQAERERIKLYMEVLDKKPEVRAAAIELIKEAFPTDNDVFLRQEQKLIDAVTNEDRATLEQLLKQAIDAQNKTTDSAERAVFERNINDLRKKLSGLNK